MDQFQATFHLRTPSNETWEVLVKAGLGVSIIDKGLSEFMDCHKVELNYKLIFTFNPPYEFKVVILNSGGREIYYPKRMQKQNIGLTNVYQNTMHTNLDTDVHENELLRNCLNYLYYRVDHLVSQNHVNPSQWSFKFVCKNYDWKYKVDIPALEAVQFIGRDRTIIIVWKLPKPRRRLDHPMPFKLGYGRSSWQVAVVVAEKDGNLYFTDGVEIDYGFPPLPEAVQISSDDDDVIGKPIGKDDEVEFTLTVADDNRIEFQTEITRAG
ncbi:hypothetical protein GH714_016643 [Hevea brasiliensis]|uniref:Uncharacterized protein n=1 Tax=Hevea brasiliensis TaxID=3981 RepID=A0A6A6L0B9_HEVBR|nr:hypothetical protein GH714_016643 [Hevea brasiliensis]